jgi:hypothetical protein
LGQGRLCAGEVGAGKPCIHQSGQQLGRPHDGTRVVVEAALEQCAGGPRSAFRDA